jgi:hypothetical protein
MACDRGTEIRTPTAYADTGRSGSPHVARNRFHDLLNLNFHFVRMHRFLFVLCGICFVSICVTTILTRAFAAAEGRNPGLVPLWETDNTTLEHCRDEFKNPNCSWKKPVDIAIIFFMRLPDFAATAMPLIIGTVHMAAEEGKWPEELHGFRQITRWIASLALFV